jgi:hypothetical protein
VVSERGGRGSVVFDAIAIGADRAAGKPGWFMGVFLGAPVSYVSVRLGGLAGLGGLLLVALAVVIARRQGRTPEPSLVVTAGACLYIVGSALMIAYGRLNPADPAAGAALAARYISVPLTFCANLSVVIGWLIMRLPRGRTATLHVSAAALTLLILATNLSASARHSIIVAAEGAIEPSLQGSRFLYAANMTGQPG